ncbi:unnamed protein product, partial [Sphacelaria rigidula]
VCYLHCAEKGAALMMLQFGRLCWCGEDAEIEPYTCGGDGVCNIPCPGNADVTCGGVWEHDLYILNENYDVPAMTPTVSPSGYFPTLSPVNEEEPAPTPESVAPVGTPAEPVAPTPEP